MSTNPIEPADSVRALATTRDAVREEAFVTALQALAAACGRNVERGLITAAVRRLARSPDVPAAWSSFLREAAHGVGLHITAERLSWDAARTRIAPDAPLVAPLGPDGNPVALVRVDGAGVWAAAGEHADAERFAGADELAERLGEAEIEWCGADAERPLDAVQSGGDGGHGGHGGPSHHDGDHGHMSPVARAWALLMSERDDFATIVAYTLGMGLLTLTIPIAVQNLVTAVAFGGVVQPVIVLTLLTLVFLGLQAAFRAMQLYVVELLQRRVFVRVTADLAWRLPRVQLAAFDRDHGPELVNRFFDVLTVQKAGAALLVDGLATTLQAAVGMFVLALYDPILLGFDLVLLACVAFIVFGLGRRGVATSIAESYAKYAVAGWLEETARHPLAFRAAGAAEYARERADALARTYIERRSRHFGVVFAQYVSAFALQATAQTALLGVGGWLVLVGRLSLGQLVAAEFIVGLVVSSVTKLGKHIESFYDLAAAMDKLGHLVDLPLERLDGEPHRARGPARVDVRGVRFAFDDGDAVLDGLDLTLAAGAHTALTGRHGTGKSVLLDLLYALRAPTGGVVLLDGADLRGMRLDDVRRHVAFVRGPEIVPGSIADNVALGRPYVTPTEVRAALDAVGLTGEVLALPAGVSTPLYAGGAPLSQGQVRRLMLARALAGRPRLLLIDETLDGLETHAWSTVAGTVFAPDAPWTAFVATHNADVVRAAGRVLRLDDGRLDDKTHLLDAPPSAGELEDQR